MSLEDFLKLKTATFIMETLSCNITTLLDNMKTILILPAQMDENKFSLRPYLSKTKFYTGGNSKGIESNAIIQGLDPIK